MTLAAGGAEAIIIGSNTTHKYASCVEEVTGLSVLHIADATIARLKADGRKRIALIGTRFTMTEDLSSAYPAKAARDLGWTQVALLCAREIPVPGALPRTIRLLLHWNTDLPQSGISHVYLEDAGRLRPD